MITRPGMIIDTERAWGAATAREMPRLELLLKEPLLKRPIAVMNGATFFGPHLQKD
jgi:hypothetical protein